MPVKDEKEKSNFDRMCDHARLMFTEYERESLAGKYGLPFDDSYIYINFFSSPFRVERATGNVFERAGDSWIPADAACAMTFYDVLCYGRRSAKATGEYVNINSLVHMISATGNPGDGFNSRSEKLFDGKERELHAALLSMHGTPCGKGDVAYQLPMFDFMDCRFQFWNSDDEFPASLNFFTDTGILDYMHYETVWYTVSWFLKKLERLAGLRT